MQLNYVLPQPLFRRFTISVVAVLLAIMLGAAAISWRNYQGVQTLFKGNAPAAVLNTPRLAGVANLQPVYFISSDGAKLAAWYVPPTNGAAVILAHGSNTDRSSMLAELRLLADAGFGVLAFDWPGLGQSEGKIRWDGQARRALASAVDWLATRPGVDAKRIGSVGFSIGGYVLAQVAAQDQRLRAIVLEAPPPDFRDYLEEHDTRWGYVSEWAAWLAAENSGLLDPALEPDFVIAKVAPRPVLMVGGSEDDVVSSELVSKLFNAAREPKSLWIVPGAGHGDYSTVAAADYKNRLTDFFTANLLNR